MLIQTTLSIVILLLSSVNAISHYDFNACRISNCNAEEQNCIAQEQGCLNYFSDMRTCFESCGDVYNNFNPCWQQCKGSGPKSNPYWLSMSLCYQNVCYVYQQWLTISLIIFIFALLL